MSKKNSTANKFQFVVAAHWLAPRYQGLCTVEKTNQRAERVTKRVDGKCVQLVLRELADTADGETGRVYASYDRLMHFTGIRSKETIRLALDVLERDKVIIRKRRFSSTSVTFLNLGMMRKLRVPFLSKQKREILDRVNAFIKAEDGDDDAMLTAEVITRMNDDKYIWDVLDWYATLQESHTAQDAYPSDSRLAKEIASEGVAIFSNWMFLLRGYSYRPEMRDGYRNIRLTYFKSLGQEEPALDWPKHCENNDRWWFGEQCDDCGQWHHEETRCKPEDVQVWKSLSPCDQCGVKHRGDCARDLFELEPEDDCAPRPFELEPEDDCAPRPFEVEPEDLE